MAERFTLKIKRQLYVYSFSATTVETTYGAADVFYCINQYNHTKFDGFMQPDLTNR